MLNSHFAAVIIQIKSAGPIFAISSPLPISILLPSPFYFDFSVVQVGNRIELEAVGFQFEPYQWRPCGVAWDSSRTVVVITLLRTSALAPT